MLTNCLACSLRQSQSRLSWTVMSRFISPGTSTQTTKLKRSPPSAETTACQQDVQNNDINLRVHEFRDTDSIPARDSEPLNLRGIKNSNAFMFKHHPIELRKLPALYAKLSKARLSALVVATASAGYAVTPAWAAFDPVLFTCVTIGTFGLSASANTINQIFEVPFDSQMKRTKSRVLVVGQLSSVHAASFALVSSLAGHSLLYFGTNGLTAAIGLANLIIYTCVYTPMKRYSIANTWAGSIVGALPPLMGWAAACGELSIGAFVLAGVLYSWQFPHFNALSWNLRPDYSQAGYRMMCVVNPKLCTRVTLRHSIALGLMCSLVAPLTDVTGWVFAIDSLPLNLAMIYFAYKFHKNPDAQSSRRLFRFTLIYLPAVMMLMIIGKKSSNLKAVNTPAGTVNSQWRTVDEEVIVDDRPNLEVLRHRISNWIR